MQVLVPLGEEVCCFELLHFNQMSQCEPENDKIKALISKIMTKTSLSSSLKCNVLNDLVSR